MSSSATGTGGTGTMSTRDGGVMTSPDSGRPDLGTVTRRVLAAGETWVFAALIIMMAIFTGLAPGKFLTISDLSLAG